MPHIDFMDKVVLYAQPTIGERTATVVDLKANYNTWCPSQNIMETDKSDFYSEEDEKKTLVPEFNQYFRKPSVNLEWRNISYKTPEGKKILDGLNGSARSGELTAIMGPSGAGKTSLLNVLTGYYQKRVSGQIYVNGVPRDMLTFRKLSCYIIQDDHVLDRFTVKELVTIASRLKLPTAMSKKEREKIVEDCLYSFGLDAHKNQRANTLSGGQRKRLCIAQEIVSNPPLIFLDEPTSGLDSSSCLQCMQLLKSLAEEGRNVICTIHQPSSRIYEIFDNIYMISEGQCIFRGPTKNLIPFLANQGLRVPKYHSPTDFIIDVAIGLYGDWNWKLRKAIDSIDEKKGRWYEIDTKNAELPETRCCQPLSSFSMFKRKVKDATKKEDNAGVEMPDMTKLSLLQSDKEQPEHQENWIDDSFSGYPTGFWNQFTVLLKRSYFNVARAPQVLFLKLAASAAIGLLFGSLYYNTGNDGSLIFNTSGFLFTLMVFLIVSAKVPTILTFPIERAIFEREHMNGWYSTSAYYLARTSANIPFQLIFPSVTSAIVYWLSGQPQEFDRFFYFLLSTVMISLIAESVGFLLGAAFSVESAMYLAGVVTSPLLVLSGAILPVTDIPGYLRWACDYMYTKYGLQSVLKNIFLDRPRMDCSKKLCFFPEPANFLKFKGIEGDMATDYYAMLGYFIIFRIAAFVVLYFKASQRR